MVPQQEMGFEALEHELDGEQFIVPLLLDDNRNPSHVYTEPLLRAAEVIAPRLEDSSSNRLNLSSLLDRVGVLIACEAAEDPPKHLAANGLIIEDEEGGGSIVVKKEIATVALREKLEVDVPSQLFLNMLRSWDKILKARQQAS